MPIRVLCLHGHGSNCKVLEAQTAALRHELDDDYEWIFVNGTVPVPMAPELEGFYNPSDDYYGYFSLSDPKSLQKAMNDLHEFITAEGNIDIVMASSIASSLIGNLLQTLEAEGQSLFKGAIFFSGMAPLDLATCEKGDLRFLEPAEKHKLISIPTANIWGSRDEVHAHSAPRLSAFCSEEANVNVIHTARTPIPGAADEFDLVAAAHAIRKTVEKAVAVY
ncbi:serine hydrolase FSH [Bisporella sp. PMI_857]|nr:serine hydrolase FSH [Bisporella sp. PMI_857]